MMSMSMPSTTFLMIGLVVAVALVGALYAAVRIAGARQVESDHPRHAPVDPARELTARDVAKVATSTAPRVR